MSTWPNRGRRHSVIDVCPLRRGLVERRLRSVVKVDSTAGLSLIGVEALPFLAVLTILVVES
jgi:hypothetical protein